MVHDMTQGKLFPILVKFTIPLVLGNLLQLTYNAVDSIVVGRFVGATALAAVGTSNPLMTLIILFEQGICLGTGVLIGMMYGAKQMDRLRREVSTGLLSGALFSVLMSVLVMVFAPQILRILQVEKIIIGEASVYLRVIGFGLIFNFIYNYFAGTLRAMGDAKSPLYFLAISAALNILGDLFFVCVLRMGILGAAVATVVSEGLSGILCWIYVQKKIPVLQLGREWLIFDFSLLRLTLSYGFVSALQQSAVQFGKLGVQAIVNTMGVASTAAFSAVNRADDYAMVIEQNIAHAMTSVMAQNEGAGKHRRVLAVFRYGMSLELVYGVFSGVLFYLLAGPMMQLFTSDPARHHQRRAGVLQGNRGSEGDASLHHGEHVLPRCCGCPPCLWPRHGHGRHSLVLSCGLGFHDDRGVALSCEEPEGGKDVRRKGCQTVIPAATVSGMRSWRSMSALRTSMRMTMPG